MQSSIIKSTVVLNPKFPLNPQIVVQNRSINFPVFLRNNISLLSYTDKARWASGQLVDADNTINNITLAWMGKDNDSNGFVRLDNGVVMEDHQTYMALRTHPKWVNNGTIKGWLPWVQQNGSGTFKASVGFLNGAAGTDGVTFQVWVHYHVAGVEHWEPVIQQRKNYSGQLIEISANLSKWANQAISIEMRVDAGASSTRDWAAWINPRIEIAPEPLPIPVPDKPGPIITSDKPVVYNDRNDPNQKWYLPDFGLKSPLKGGFMFTCFKDAEPDAEKGKITYNGEINFVLEKNVPTAVTALVSANPGAKYSEIPLTNLVVNFVLVFTTQQPVTYAGIITPNNNEYAITLKPDPKHLAADRETYLESIFNFVSNPDNAPYCTISINASYSGYLPKSAPILYKFYQNSFRLNNLKIASPEANVNPVNPHQLIMDRPEMVATPSVAAPANTVADNSVVQYNYNNALGFSKTIGNVNYPCSGANGFSDNYVIKDLNTLQLTPFYCHLPFGDGSADNSTYFEFNPANTVLYDPKYGISAIYRNTKNFNYLIIPLNYVIMLERTSNSSDNDQLIPSAYLTTIVDAAEIVDDTHPSKSLATFHFHITPAISAYNLDSIKKLIADNTPAANKISKDDITIEFPSVVLPEKPVVFDNVKNTKTTFMGGYEYGVPGSNYFLLELQDVSIGDASAESIAKKIKGQMQGVSMATDIFFDIDSKPKNPVHATIDLSLNKIMGNGLSLIKNDEKVYLLNDTFYDISIDSLSLDSETTLNPSLVIGNNNTLINNTSVVAPPPVTPDNYLNVIPRYTFKSSQDYINNILAEMSTDVQKVSIYDSVIVTNNTGLFKIYNIDHIIITLYILPEGVTDYTKVLPLSKSIAMDGSINYIPFGLTIDQYSSKLTAVYTTYLTFTDKTVQQNEKQVIDNLNNIGKVINLTVTNLNLSKP
ncbi:MAG: hypothetical protein M3Z26_02240 [Bacteroidota bacterium]|nr:hypothetical protein [Bacteroidota bacterium]